MFRNRKALLASAAITLTIAAPGMAEIDGDAAAGAAIFDRACAVCHDIGDDAEHGLGPALSGVFGSPFATAEGFEQFSEAMIARGQAGEVWDADTLRAFLAAPMHFEPATTMAFPGILDEGELEDLLAYLAEVAG